MLRRMLRLLPLLVFGACATAKPQLTSEVVDFGGVRASMRDFPGGTICEAEPRFLMDELASVNALLRRFLQDAPQGVDADWSDAGIALIAEGQERLPALLERHARSLAAVGRCEFGRSGAFSGLVERGQDFIAKTRARLAAAPGELAAVKQARALAEWKQRRAEQQEGARRSCPSKPTSRIYFAWLEGQRTTWLFCDGALVTRDESGPASVELPPDGFSKGKRPTEAVYLAAVKRYPAEAVVAPPVDAVLSAW